MMAGNYANNLSAEPNSKRLCIQNQQDPSGDPSSLNRVSNFKFNIQCKNISCIQLEIIS